MQSRFISHSHLQVNDLYATSSDPNAWEFRHPLFRQGEPHLLASIKRKSTRTNTHDGHSLVSPSDEVSEARAMAGWMRDPAATASAAAQSQMVVAGPPREPTRQVFGYDIRTGVTIESRKYETTARASTRDYFETVRRDGRDGRVVSLNTPEGDSRGGRGHPPPAAPPYGDYLYPQPTGSHYPPLAPETLTAQVAQLQDEVVRLRDRAAQARADGARREMDAITHTIKLTTWLPGESAPVTR
jgi:hypothetical protein